MLHLNKSNSKRERHFVRVIRRLPSCRARLVRSKLVLFEFRFLWCQRKHYIGKAAVGPWKNLFNLQSSFLKLFVNSTKGKEKRRAEIENKSNVEFYNLLLSTEKKKVFSQLYLTRWWVLNKSPIFRFKTVISVIVFEVPSSLSVHNTLIVFLMT